MSCNSPFYFTKGAQVVVTGGTWFKKNTTVMATVMHDILQRNTMVTIQFDVEKIGNTVAQRMRGKQLIGKTKKTNIQLLVEDAEEVNVTHTPRRRLSLGSTEPPTVSPVLMSRADILNTIDQMDLEDAPISTELKVRICDLCHTFKQEGIRRYSPTVHALICMGMNEVEHDE